MYWFLWQKSSQKRDLKKVSGVRMYSNTYLRHHSFILQYCRIRDQRLTVVIDMPSSSAISRCVLPATRACMSLILSSIVSISWGVKISSMNPSRSYLWRFNSAIMFLRRVAWYDILFVSLYYYDDTKREEKVKKKIKNTPGKGYFNLYLSSKQSQDIYLK